MKKRHVARVIAAAAFLSLSFSSVSYAGEWKPIEGAWYYEENQEKVTGWEQIGDKWYYFDENGKMETGWIKEGGRWYRLNEESGEWEKKPVINKTSACYLLENAVQKAGLYQNEDYPLIYRVEAETSEYVKVLIQVEELPDRYKTINSYEVSRKTGIAKAAVGDDLPLYEKP